MVGMEGVLVAFQSLSAIEKGTSHSNFQLNEPFLKFLRQLLRYKVLRSFYDNFLDTKCPGLKGKIINYTLCQRRSYMPPGINWNSCPESCGGVSSSSFSKFFF